MLVILRMTLTLLNMFSYTGKAPSSFRWRPNSAGVLPFGPSQGTMQHNLGQEEHLLLVDWEGFGLYPVQQPREGEGGQDKATSTPRDFKVFLDLGSWH